MWYTNMHKLVIGICHLSPRKADARGLWVPGQPSLLVRYYLKIKTITPPPHTHTHRSQFADSLCCGPSTSSPKATTVSRGRSWQLPQSSSFPGCPLSHRSQKVVWTVQLSSQPLSPGWTLLLPDSKCLGVTLWGLFSHVRSAHSRPADPGILLDPSAHQAEPPGCNNWYSPTQSKGMWQEE